VAFSSHTFLYHKKLSDELQTHAYLMHILPVRSIVMVEPCIRRAFPSYSPDTLASGTNMDYCDCTYSHTRNFWVGSEHVQNLLRLIHRLPHLKDVYSCCHFTWFLHKIVLLIGPGGTGLVDSISLDYFKRGSGMGLAPNGHVALHYKPDSDNLEGSSGGRTVHVWNMGSDST